MVNGVEPERWLRVEGLSKLGLFVLTDRVQDGPLPFDDGIIPDEIVVTTPAGVGLRSAARDFFPLFHIQIFRAAPPRGDTAGWDGVFDMEVACAYGRLSLDELSAGPLTVIYLEPGDWFLRCWVGGRDEAAERAAGEMNLHGVEEWLLQLWPKDLHETPPRIPSSRLPEDLERLVHGVDAATARYLPHQTPPGLGGYRPPEGNPEPTDR